MKFTVSQIAGMIGGTVEGDAQAEVGKLCKIEEGEVGGLSFLANSKYINYLYETKATAVIVSKDFQPEHAVSATLIRVENPYLAFATLLKQYNELQLNKKGVDPLAYVHPTAVVGADCYIGPFAYIGENVTLGDRVKIYHRPTWATTPRWATRRRSLPVCVSIRISSSDDAASCTAAWWWEPTASVLRLPGTVAIRRLTR